MNGSLRIIGTGTYLPSERVDVRRAVSDYPAREQDRILANGYTTLSVEPVLFPGDMGLLAAIRALEDAGVDAASVRMIVYTSIHRHGHKRMWSPASWIQERLGCTNALPFNVHQGCNAQLLLMDVASDVLRGRHREGETVLVVAADRFSGSAFDRFTSDYGIVYGDGAAAAVVSAGSGGGWRILGSHSVSDPWLEGLHRADRAQPENPDSLADEHDMRSAKRGFLRRHGKEALSRRTQTAVATLREALVSPEESDRISGVIYPNLGRPLLETAYYPQLPGGADRSLWSFGSTVGHLGSADQVAGLDTWTRRKAPAPGDRLLLVGAGAGFSWTGMLLERDRPATITPPATREKEQR